MEVLGLFERQSLHYLLFKCEHIFAGQNKNLDILFPTKYEYRQAARLLEEKGFALRLPEKTERYKSMYCFLHQNQLYSVHLHREIAWHGMIALDKRLVFQRQRKINRLISVPSPEDSLLIHAGHVFFENFRVTPREKEYFTMLRLPNFDRDYLQMQLKKNHWKKGFRTVVQNNIPSQRMLMALWSLKLLWEPATTVYLLQKGMRLLLRKMDPRKKGCLLSFIGVNGSGKSTLSRKVLEAYAPCTQHLGKRQHYYYYGWNPRFFLTRVMSHLLRKKNTSVFKNTALQKKIQKFDLFQELLFIYLAIEYYYRYWADIRPKLRRGSVVVTDRYFYDIYGQYPYAVQSRLLPLLMKIFPRPHVTFHLTAPLAELRKRGKTDRNSDEQIVTRERSVFPEEYLAKQQQNYGALTKLVPLRTLETVEDLEETCRSVLNRTWRLLI